MRSFLSVVFLVACAPSYQADIDTMLASHPGDHRQIAAPARLESQPWKVGQWALYKVTRNQDVGYFDVSITAQDACGMWIRQVTQGTSHRLVLEMCFKTLPVSAEDAPKLVQMLNVKLDEATQTVDFREGKHEDSRALVKSYATWFAPIDWSAASTMPRDDIDLPSGLFAQSIRSTGTAQMPSGPTDTTTWTHPEVPLGGTIKVSASNGTELALQAYGQTRP